MARPKKIITEPITASITQEEVSKLVPSPAVLTESVDFNKIRSAFFHALEELRLKTEHNEESKALIGNAWAYMTKAIRAVDLLKEMIIK